MNRLLIAGVGNIFLGDDGFGVELARRLTSMAWPDTVRVVDVGIRGIHLAYDLLDQTYKDVVLLDAVSRGEKPGTLYVLDLNSGDRQERAPIMADAHSVNPQVVVTLIRSIMEAPPRLWLVGCEPERVDEEMGLSAAVQQAVEEAIPLVHSLVLKLSEAGEHSRERTHHA